MRSCNRHGVYHGNTCPDCHAEIDCMKIAACANAKRITELEADIKKAVEDERGKHKLHYAEGKITCAAEERERTDAYRTSATVEFYIHKFGRCGRLPVIDFLPESLIGEEVEVIIRQRGAQ